MRKSVFLLSVLVGLSASAFANNGANVQHRQGHLDLLDSELCLHVSASAVVHEDGARFTVNANGCIPGDVMTIWAFAGNAPVLLNCGGGIVLPNGQFKTICDVPRGQIAPCLDCAQAFLPGVIGNPPNMTFAVEMLTHDDLDPGISMSQIRTLHTCSFFGGPDSCATVAFLSFPVP